MGKKQHKEPRRKRESHLERGQSYKRRCKSANKGFNRGGIFSQVHHILCDHAVARRVEAYKKQDDDGAYMEACLWEVVWSINDLDNLIGLPTSAQYVASSGATPENFVSHTVDHNTTNGYTDEVADWLHKKVWNKLKAKKKVHDTDVQKINSLLESGTRYFAGELECRGMRESGAGPGTRAGWKHRFEEACEYTWYHPFSMAAVPNHRYPGRDPEDLAEIFELLAHLS